MLGPYHEGVGAIDSIAASLSEAQWQSQACGTWTAIDLAGHLVCVVGWYHDWLDRALHGDATPPFDATDLAERNAAALSTLPLRNGPDRVSTFSREARRYADRLETAWDLPYGFPYGTVTAGLHAGVAATEWHLHAWDLSGGSHRPRDPRLLFLAAGAALTATRRGPIGRLSAAMVPLVARRRPWEQLLKRSGRGAR